MGCGHKSLLSHIPKSVLDLYQSESDKGFLMLVFKLTLVSNFLKVDSASSQNCE